MAGEGPVLVVGGTGALGGKVVEALLDRGKQVRALVRPSSDAGRLEAKGVAVARGDMMDPDSLRRAMDGVDAVVTTAAGYTRHSKGDSPDIDVAGNRNLADAAAQTGVRRFVLTSILTCDETPGVPLLAREARRGPAVVPTVKDMTAMFQWFGSQPPVKGMRRMSVSLSAEECVR